jgi:GNAT superfamily N-acetyltransferase
MTPVITLTDRPNPNATSVIENGLAQFNREQAGYSDYRYLAVLVSDPETKQVLGGILGRTSLGICFLDVVFLPATLRGQNVGTRMMAEAEGEARRRGCRAVLLYTISFQAPGFYEKLGYRAFGRIDCHPPGTSRIFMVKDL